jgi:PAS domain S-box-containing protein
MQSATAAVDPRGVKSGERAARWLPVVGMVMAAGFALAYWVWPLATGAAASRIASLACALLAAMYALLVLLPRVFGIGVMAGLTVLGAGAVAVVVAAVGGDGLLLPGLAFVPLILCAAAPLIPVGATAALSLVHGALLTGLAAGVFYGAIPAQHGVAGLGPALAQQAALLVAGTVIGLLTRRAIHSALARARLRERRFVGLLAVAADWYWETDAELRYTHIARHGSGAPNAALEDRVGKAPWEISDFGLDDDAMDAHRSDLELRRPFTDLRVQQRGADGAWRCLSLSGRPRFDARGVFVGYWGVGRDITDQDQAESQRSATELRYRELFARSPSPLVLHRDGRVLDANVAALALFGAWEQKDLIGRSLLSFYDTEDGSRELAARRLARLASVPIGEAAPPQQFSIRTTAGRRLAVQVTSVKVEAEGGEALLSIYRDETERQRAEGARARSEALLSHVVATSPDVITLTDLATGRLVMVNDAFVALSGYSRDEAIGRTAVELGLWPSEAVREQFASELLAHDGVRDRSLVQRSRDGREVLMLVSAARFEMEGRDYLVLNGRDITQSERARLEREAILSHASIGIAMTRDRVFQLANPSFEQMFGWPAGELVGQGGEVTSVDSAAYAELGALYGPLLARGEAVEFERPMKRRDGSTFLCRLLARPIDPTHPAKGGTIWIAEDVTEKRAVERALARARDDAEAANRAKSAFLANTSHEIRTPLNGLVGLARLARQPGLDSARREQYLAQIDDSAQALAGVISDILDLSKIEAGKLRLEQTDFDLHALLESVEHGYAALAEAHALALTMHVSGAVPRRVRGDPVRLRQILSNFLSNALKFTAAGYVRLHVKGAGPPQALDAPLGGRERSEPGASVLAPDAPLVRFEIEDSGPGITAEVQARLFQPFTQGDVSTTRRYGGTGLGLSICRELAELMGGRVGVSSEPGRGSRFWAELPLPASEQEAPPSAFSPLDSEERPLAGLDLLIVEDNPVNMMIATTILRQWGVTVSEAVNGAEAVAVVNARADVGRPFDLVLMDVQMPVQGGHDATRVLRRRFPADVLPIIALTAAALTSERDEALAAGMNDFLTKPLDAQRLQDTLLRWGAFRKAAADAAATPPVSTS